MKQYDLELLPLPPTARLDYDNEYCCICLNTFDYAYIQLKCCHQNIHSLCLIDWILSESNNTYNCPICRKDIILDASITLGQIIDYINTKTDASSGALITKKKIETIIKRLYNNTNIKQIMYQESENNNRVTEDEVLHRIEILSNTHNKMKALFVCTLGVTILFVMIIYYMFKEN
jgi:hypothetical protein